MKPLLLFIVLACVSWSSFPHTPSQNQEDTLKNSYLNSEKSIPKNKDTLSEFINFKKSIAISTKSKDYKTLAKSFIGLAKWHEDHTILDSSIVYLQKAKYAKRIGRHLPTFGNKLQWNCRVRRRV